MLVCKYTYLFIQNIVEGANTTCPLHLGFSSIRRGHPKYTSTMFGSGRWRPHSRYRNKGSIRAWFKDSKATAKLSSSRLVFRVRQEGSAKKLTCRIDDRPVFYVIYLVYICVDTHFHSTRHSRRWVDQFFMLYMRWLWCAHLDCMFVRWFGLNKYMQIMRTCHTAYLCAVYLSIHPSHNTRSIAFRIPVNTLLRRMLHCWASVFRDMCFGTQIVRAYSELKIFMNCVPKCIVWGRPNVRWVPTKCNSSDFASVSRTFEHPGNPGRINNLLEQRSPFHIHAPIRLPNT